MPDRLSALFFRFIDRYKAQHKVSYSEIAKRSGISPSQFSEIIRRKSRLGVIHIDKVCTGLNVSLREMVLEDTIEGELRGTIPDLNSDEEQVLGKVLTILRTPGSWKDSLLATVELFDEYVLGKSYERKDKKVNGE